jgi:RHS repeat-associated protein
LPETNHRFGSKKQGPINTWDYENRLTGLVLPGTGGSLSFKYDAFGRRVQKVFTQNSTTTTTNYLYDQLNPVEDVDATGDVLARYIDAMNIDEPLEELRTGAVSYYHADGLGSITSLSNSSSTLTNTYTYDSFGNVTASVGTLANRFEFAGREFDPEFSAYFYRSRYYDATSGRFLSEDPCRSEVGWSFYSFLDNDTPNLNDWSGCKGSKLPPPPNLPKGTPKNLVHLFNDGWDNMLHHLDQKDCRKFFCSHGDNPQKVLNTLQNTSYRYASLDPTSGAVTFPGGTVFINSGGLFVSASSGKVTIGSLHCNVGNDSDIRGLILLHELGHELGIFGADSGPELAGENAAHSMDIINSCFPGSCIN